MKKLISLLLTICLILSLGAFSVSAEDAKLDKKDWKIEASSSFGDSAKYAIDGKIESYWHSFYEVVEGTAANKAGAPHELTITLPSLTVISGFSYTPRTGGSTTGFVLKYELYAADETSELKLIKSGEFEKKLEEQTVKFDYNIEAKTVVFRMTETVATSGVVAEFDLLAEDSSLSKKAISDISGATLEARKEEEAAESNNSAVYDKSTWKAEASSVMGKMDGSWVLDGKRETYWHTYYEAIDGKAENKTPPPYDLTIDLGAEYVISGFVYTPREGNSTTGRVTKYEFYGSDGSDDFKLIASGSFVSDMEIKNVKFKNNIPVKKVQFKILEVVGGCGVVAEFDLLKENSSLSKVALSSVKAEVVEATSGEAAKPAAPTTPAAPVAPTTPTGDSKKVEGEVPVDERYVDKNGWTAYAKDSFPSGNTIEKSIDGDPKTFWHSYYTAGENGGENVRPPMPYDVIYTLPNVTTVAGFCYTPRQSSGSNSGRVLEYEIYVTGDDSDNWVKITEGKFTNDDAAKDVDFAANIDVKKVMFRITSGMNKYAVIGEFDLMVENGQLEKVELAGYEQFVKDNRVFKLDPNLIGAESDSVWSGHIGAHAFDGNYGTFWHKNPSDTGTMLLKVDLGKIYTVAGFTYYPRRDDIKGHWKKFNLYASVDGNEFFPVLEDEVLDVIDFTSKDVRFNEPVEFRYVEFEITEYHGHCAAAEIEFYQTKEIAVEESKSEKYVLQIDNPVIISEIDGEVKETTLDVAPFIKNSNTMIPLRGLLEAMGATIEWNGDNQSIKIVKESITIDMQIRNILVYVTNVKGTVRYSFRTAPVIKDGRTFIPLRFISENLGYEVAWDGETRTITITTPEIE